MKTDFSLVTEIAGDEVTRDQIERICQRYCWAGAYADGRDVIEVACGTATGFGYLNGRARSLIAGDLTPAFLALARRHYGGQAPFVAFDAGAIPIADRGADVIILFEALYYLPAPDAFVAECRRILRPGGVVLIATANKDLPDFNPSDFSYRYFNAPELRDLFAAAGFTVRCFAGSPVGDSGAMTRILRLAKRIAVRFGLIPKTMAGKKLLKRLVFGRLQALPGDIAHDAASSYSAPVEIANDKPDFLHKVIFCEATLKA